MYVCISSHVHTFMSTHTCTYVHVHIHTYTYAYICTYVSIDRSNFGKERPKRDSRIWLTFSAATLTNGTTRIAFWPRRTAATATRAAARLVWGREWEWCIVQSCTVWLKGAECISIMSMRYAPRYCAQQIIVQQIIVRLIIVRLIIVRRAKQIIVRLREAKAKCELKSWDVDLERQAWQGDCG
jgi:hypothetical protein